MEFENVTAIAKGNLYFEGNVLSHAIVLPDGSKKTLGFIRPGKYYFGTEKAERMEISDGSCKVLLDGSKDTVEVTAGSYFEVPANSGFSIEVDSICQYVCSYLG